MAVDGKRVLQPVDPADDEVEIEKREDAQSKAADVEVILVPVAKESSELAAGQAEAEKAEEELWGAESVLQPIYSTGGLLFLFRNSASLRQIVEAMVHNVSGFGYTLEPVIDFDAEDLRQQVATAMHLDRLEGWEREVSKWRRTVLRKWEKQADEAILAGEDPPDAPSEPGQPGEPSTDDIDREIAEWQRIAAVEKARLKQHFETCCFETSFTELRKQTRLDREVIGWGAQEVIRSNGIPARYKHVPAYTLRYRPKSQPIPVTERVLTSPTTYKTMRVWRRFRLIVQSDEADQPKRYFREFGDPRIVSSLTGTIYESEQLMRAEEGKSAQVANELLLFQTYFPGSSYGVPRYHGIIPEIKGAWLAANHVVDYLENSAIPRGILLVNDGRLNKKSVRDIKNYFGTVRGRAENRIAVIQAETPRDRAFEASGRVKMEFVDMSNAQREDAMFAKYDEAVTKKVSQAFRLPPLIRGETKDFNKATSQSALQYAEDQVFAPERATEDWVINRRILPELGIRFWRVRSRGPIKQDPEIMTKVLETLLKQGVVVPAEVRTVAERLLGVDLLRVAGDWQQLPIVLVQQGFKSPEKRPASAESEDAGKAVDDDNAPTPPEPIAKLGDLLTQFERVVGADDLDAAVDESADRLSAERGEHLTLAPDRE